MSEFTAKVSTKGQVVIPDALRTVERIEEGDYVVLVLKEVKKA